jgi:hypothetical protein
MRGLAVLALALAALVASTTGSAGGWSASLRISYWDGPGVSPNTVWTLRCNPAGGSLARPVRACRKLAAGGVKLFAPTRPDTVCTEIYGGPQRARIVGTVGGTRVSTTVTRTNGCEIGRWTKLSPWLLPPRGVT